MEELDILPLLGTVVYPQTVTPIAIAQPNAVRLLEGNGGKARRIGVVALRSSPQRRPELPSIDDCYAIGTLALVHRLLRLPDGTLRVAIEGLERFELLETLSTTPNLRAVVRHLPEEAPDQHLLEKMDQLKALAAVAAERVSGLSHEMVEEIAAEDEPRRLAYLVASALMQGRPLAERQEILTLPSVEARLERLSSLLGNMPQARATTVSHGARGFDVISAERAGEPPHGRSLWLRRTAQGSEAVPIDAVRMSGTGDLIVTGQRGRLMRDTAQIGLSWLRTAAQRLGIDPDFYARSAIHVHIPAGALPDEQPAAGAAVALALASAVLRRPSLANAAVCGDLSLHGQLAPVRDLADKLVAAQRAGISTFVVAAAHAHELVSIAEELAPAMRIFAVENLADALDELLV
jgi:ATP-dependent Lon protease